jgi:glycine/D-amino acid oxidase-like deaminating enzyme
MFRRACDGKGENDMEQMMYDGRALPVLANVDVLVVGGGFPGICAALAAGRAGAKTLLAERNAVLGGQAAEIDTWGIDGFVNAEGKLLIDGLPWEVLHRALAEGQSDPLWTRLNMDLMEKEGIPAALHAAQVDEYIPYCDTGTFMNPFNDQYVDPNAYRYAAHTMLAEAGVELLLEAPVIDVIMEGEQVAGVVVQAFFSRYALLARRVVDATQNGALSAMAGHPFRYPRAYMGTLTRVANVDVSRLIEFIRHNDEDWFLRPMVGKKADPDEMARLAAGGNPLAIHGFMKTLERAIGEHPEYASLNRTNGEPLFFFYERDGGGSYWTFGDAFADVDTSDPLAYSQAVAAARTQQWLMHRFFRDYVPGFERAHLMDVYGNISKAYMQSMEPSGLTEYDITAGEIVTGRTERADVITIIRGHPNAGQNQSGWAIPLQALIPRGLVRLVLTGKPVCRKIHYIASCAKVGEAAGAAAAVSALEGTPLRETDAAKVREALKRRK